MNEILTIVEHQSITISKDRNIDKNILSYEDRELLFDIEYTDKKGKKRFLFSNNGKNKIKACSIVGSVSLKNGLIIEILPKFAKGNLTEELKKQHRKTLIGMIKVSNEKNFITTQSQSGKISMGEMPLINYIIELFTGDLVNTLRQGLHQTYTKNIKNTSKIRGNILVSKTIQNNFIDKSKVYCQYNKHSSNNLLMQVFKTLSKLLMQDDNLSYNTKQNLYEVHLLLDGVETINLKSQDFKKIVFNRLNDKYEILFTQANFIFNKYMPFSSKINSTPFWSILFSMDYLFEKFLAYLFRKSNIKFSEQSIVSCFENKTNNMMVSARPDFIIEDNLCVADAKWKLLQKDKTLYGLNAQNFWQLFSYMNLTNSNEQMNGYFIVPKNNDSFEDAIIFDSVIEGNKSVTIISIDFSLKFEEIIHNYYFELIENELKYKSKIFQKNSISDFDFEKFIENNLDAEELNLDNFGIDYIPANINKLKNLKVLNLENNHIKALPKELFEKEKIKKTEFLKLRKLEVLNLGNNNISVIPTEIKEFNTYPYRFKEICIYGNENILVPFEILYINSLETIITDEKTIKSAIKFFSIIKEEHKKNIKILNKKNQDLSVYIKNCNNETSNNKNFVKTCSKCGNEKGYKNISKYGYSEKINGKRNKAGKFGYDAHCKLCDNKRGRDRTKSKQGLLKDKYNDLKDKAKNKSLNLIDLYSQNKFVQYMEENKEFNDLYEQYKENSYDEELRPAFYLIDNQDNFSLNNIGISINIHITEIHGKNTRNNNDSMPVVQFTEDRKPIALYESMSEAYRQTGINSGVISMYCKKDNIKNPHKGYLWKLKSDVSKDIIEFLKLNNSKEIGNNSEVNLFNKTIDGSCYVLSSDKLKEIYSNEGKVILNLANNKNLSEHIKIILFYREYINYTTKTIVQKQLQDKANDKLKKLFESDIKEIVTFFKNDFLSIETNRISWIYGFAYSYSINIYDIKKIIAEQTTTSKIINILLDNDTEMLILYEILKNTHQINTSNTISFSVSLDNLKYILKKYPDSQYVAELILKRKEVDLEIVKNILAKFNHDSFILSTIKSTKYISIKVKEWITQEYPIKLSQYKSLTGNILESNIGIYINFDLSSHNEKKEFCYKSSILILESIILNNTLPLKFLFLIYVLNYNNIEFKQKVLTVIKNREVKEIVIFIELIEYYNKIDEVVEYISENFNSLNNDILEGYAMSNNKALFPIRKKICDLTNDLNILNELSKNENDINILITILMKTNINLDFRNNNEYLNILEKIARYNNLDKKIYGDKLIRLLYKSHNINKETKEYLLDIYPDIIEYNTAYYMKQNKNFSNHIEFN